MPKISTQEEFWKLYQKLPQELRDALFAEETGNSIYEICKRNEVLDNLDQIVDYVGRVLIGLLPPNEFQDTLEKELGIETEKAKRITREITRYVFFPVKTSLEGLYKIEVTPAGAVPTIAPKPTPPRPEVKPAEKPEEKPTEKEKPVTDIYREPIE
jgi:hypothetical protein